MTSSFDIPRNIGIQVWERLH